MKFGSLFTGIGGLDLGLERAGMECTWQVEKDPYAQKVLEAHWPAVPLCSDVCEFGEGFTPVDLICGGFPCQDISVAGNGAGITGTRSGLWKEFARIIGIYNPRYVLIENVPALKSRGLGTVLSDLHARGYDAEWDCLPASAFGAPHRRDRMFVVAYTFSESLRLKQRWGTGPSGKDSFVFRSDVTSRPLGNTNGEGQLQQGGRVFEIGEWSSYASWWAVEPDVGRVAHGVSSRMDRLKGLGNAVVPQVAEYLGRRIMEIARIT